jgi:ADP-ribosyl-[dinitrogen reductase] hydrolase
MKNLILATMLGDSLLLPYEGLNKKLAKKRFEKYQCKQSLFFSKGITSDDTDHMLMTAQTLLTTTSVDEFKKTLSKKLKLWLLTIPLGIGLTTLKSIIKMYLGFSSSGIFSSGNGPLMRVPVIALYYSENKEKRDEFVKASTELTHKNNDAISASQAVANFIAFINKKKIPNKEILKKVLLDVKNQDSIWTNYVFLLIDNLEQPLEIFLKKLKCEKFVSGYIMHTAIFSFYLMYHSQNLNDAFKKIILASGDTDTIGALVATYYSQLTPNEIDFSLLNLIPHVDIKASTEEIIFKNFWSNLIIKNLISIPILIGHIIIRLCKFNKLL